MQIKKQTLFCYFVIGEVLQTFFKQQVKHKHVKKTRETKVHFNVKSGRP